MMSGNGLYGQAPAYAGGGMVPASNFGMGGSGGSGMSSMDKFGMGAGIGGAASGLMGLLGGHGPNPYDKASQYMNQIPETLKPYFQPYIERGQRSGNMLEDQYKGLLSDPGAMYNKMGQGYQQSPGFQWQLGQGMNAAENAAAAGGMAGSPQHQQQAATMATGLANQDYNNYMQNVLGMYGQGMQGAQGMNQMGYGASSELGNSMANHLMNQGNMAYANQAAQNQQKTSDWGSLFGGLGSLAAFAFM